ncbi:MAG: PD40 domain-containing protein [Bacteroidales bacterium]|nr:PD40 domain-containing protein [Bacteroidales bacterium]
MSEKYIAISIAMMITAGGTALSQDYSKSIFDGNSDIGACSIKGDMIFGADTQEYTISGSGENIWFGSDQFHYAWKKMSGDFILRANISFTGQGSHMHRKIGWMVRETLDADSPHISGTVHGDGLTSLQYRITSGGETGERKSSTVAPDVIQLERKGNRYIFSCAHAGETFDTVAVSGKLTSQEVFAGIFICSHDNDVIEQARFYNVRIIRPAEDDFVPYRDYIGSNLEVMDIATGVRKVVMQSPVSIQAPNWTPDGNFLIYNSEGLLYRFDLRNGQPSKINSGFATNNNNDHVLSFDGTMLGISHHVAAEENRSVIFTMPADGGTPKRITEEGPSYLHGWSPDGRYLTYTADRDGNFDIYKISVKKKKEIRLTDAAGLDDGPEYSPDGSYIYFNSVRTGKMQIWRMRPDGSGQEQLTNDEYNNWFPHISPDGKWIVFLSFAAEINPGDHPFYTHVYIRLMPVTGGMPSVVAYVYGGQGTINVPSWSPDSKKIAFVSNTDLL